MSAFQKILFVCLILSLCSFSFAGSLVSHWKLDETSGNVAYDSAGTNNGTVYGGAVWTDGKIDGCLDFDGNGDYVRCPAIYFNSFSVAFWVKTTMEPLDSSQWWNGNGIVDAETREYRNDWGTALIDDGKIAFGIGASTLERSVTIKSTSTVNDGVWHFVTATRYKDTGKMKLYIDGELQAEGTGHTYTLNQIAFIGIGNNPSDVADNDEWFDGMIDDVRLYNYALDANEVAALYAPASQTGLVAHWTFDEGSGTTAADSAGGNNGTVYGAEWTTGKIGQALNFDGINDYVMVPNNDALDITDDITIAAWVSFARGGNGRNGSEQAIVAKTLNNGATYNPFDFRTSIGAVPQLAFVRANSSAHQFVYSTQPVPLSSWHHVAVTVKGGIANFYVDGIVTGKFHDDLFQTAAGNSRPLYIGRRDDGLYLKGLIDDVRLYNYALDANEISELYAVAAPVLLGIDIAGPNSVPEETETQYQVVGNYDGGISKIITADANLIVTPDKFASIADTGILTTERLYRLSESCTIYADCEGFAAQKAVRISPVCDGNACSPVQLLDRNINDVIGIKQDLMAELNYAMDIEKASMGMFREISKERLNGFKRGQLTEAQMKLLAAYMWEVQAKNKIDSSIDNLGDALELLHAPKPKPPTKR